MTTSPVVLVSPQDIVDAAAVKVARSVDLPIRGSGPEIPVNRRPVVHSPDRDVATDLIPPENIVDVANVVVSGSLDVPIC